MQREELFKRALKVETEELRAELIYQNVRELTDAVWDVLYKELPQLQITPCEFYEMVESEAKERQWDLSFFRNKKNEPVQNLFKKIIRQICKTANLSLTNDQLSRILNTVRKCYSDEGILSAGLYPAEAFMKRTKYEIPDDLGDLASCFRVGGCNEGSALWLWEEDMEYGRATLVVFHYQSGSKVGVGRCWAFYLDGAVYVTNFYSKHFEIKDDRFKKPIVRLVRKLFGLSENVRYAVGKYSPLPIYLNGDGIVIYEPSQYKNSDEVLFLMGELESFCRWCSSYSSIKSLTRYEYEVSYKGRFIKGLIVCDTCSKELAKLELCYECNEYYDREGMVYIESRDIYVCPDCFEERWVYCDDCDRPIRRDDAFVLPDGKIVCEHCISQYGEWCEVCGEFHFRYFIEEYDDNSRIRLHKLINRRGESFRDICDRCAERYIREFNCSCCGSRVQYLLTEFMEDEIIREMVRLEMCPSCYYNRKNDLFDDAFMGREHPSLFEKLVDPEERVLREVLEME